MSPENVITHEQAKLPYMFSCQSVHSGSKKQKRAIHRHRGYSEKMS